MKSSMPYLGLSMATLRATCGAELATQRLPSFEAWRAAVLELWHAAAFREERYAALCIVGYRDYKAFRTLEALPLYQALIVSGAWWDLVDGLASHEVGDLLRQFPDALRALREYAKVAPERVVQYVRAHQDQLSGLSKREALKHLGGLQSLAASV